jgi:hypothetical protein
MRGQKVYNEITKGSHLERALRKGRNNMLVNMRNDCLVARYYYYCHFKNKCYEDVMRLIVSEFYLSASTIANIVQNNTDQLFSMKQKCPPLYYFQTKWPHLKWA